MTLAFIAMVMAVLATAAIQVSMRGESSSHVSWGQPVAFALNPEGGGLWMVTRAAPGEGGNQGSLVQFDGMSGKPMRTYRLKLDPVAAYFDLPGRRVFIVSLGLELGTPTETVAGTVTAVDLSGKVIGVETSGIHPIGVAMDSSHTLLLVLNRGVPPGSGSVQALDPETLSERGQVGTGIYPMSIEPHPSKEFAAVPNYVSQSLTLLATDGGRITAVEAPLGNQPGRTASVSFAASSDLVVAVSLSERTTKPARIPGRVDLYDMNNRTLRWSVDVDEPSTSAVAPSGVVLVIGETDSGFEVRALDLESGRTLYAIPATGEEVAITPAGNAVVLLPQKGIAREFMPESGNVLCDLPLPVGEPRLVMGAAGVSVVSLSETRARVSALRCD
ncbi:MAG: hypothetical protein U0837_00645 [Dehalococcoidia bacterium]